MNDSSRDLAPHNAAIDEAGVRELLKSRLPRYMVPSHLVTLDTLPMTSNGKINRNALPALDLSSVPQASEPMPPRTPLESDITTVWADVLDVSAIGVDDDFFDLGGHSLDAMRVNARLSQMLHIELRLSSFFDDPTVRGQALAITGAMAAQVGEAEEIASLLSDLAGGDVESAPRVE